MKSHLRYENAKAWGVPIESGMAKDLTTEELSNIEFATSKFVF